jgi:diguanylate cyclase (GGDEF)-like protein/putative nucleotidyltransferase with HDIG domain
MVSRKGFTRLGKTYLWLVIAAGFIVIGLSIHQLYVEPLGRQWFILAALTLISGSATIRLPSSYASISTSETFVFSAVLLYGPAAGTVVVALDALVVSFWISKRQDEPHRALFNVAAPAISLWLSSHLFFLVAHIEPLVKQPSPVNAILPGLLLFALTYFTLNSWLITFVISLERKLNPITVWKRSFVWLSLNHLGSASVAFLLVGYNREIDLGYVGVTIPLLLVLYFTFKTAMARIEDSDKHLAQVNRLYLSTIETLAMAIDAKDQVTHGHIRRVQAHATGLAKAVGVKDENLLKAIEAAALLHDMGKLAVPEYILNKPGKLTAAEFEKMKLHASVGADILSAIDFPYPVVPIVRHHHENWDGTGYPTGIKGTDIPIGARILSVVDCFDALTSDRPYRPKLADGEALAILKERRGTMYDPMIVDTFFQVHPATSNELPRQGPASDVLNTIAHSRRATSSRNRASNADQVISSADEMLAVHQLARALAGQVNLGDAADVIAKHLRVLLPSSVYAFYVYDAQTDQLEAQHVVGKHGLGGGSVLRGTRIALGQRLSGWVAANRQTIANSDPSLDLADVPGAAALHLRSCLSTSLVFDDQLVGVITLYSEELNGFNDDHKRIIEVVARQIAHTLKSAAEFDEMARRDGLTGLPSFEQLEEFVGAKGGSSLIQKTAFALLFIDVVDLKQINIIHGRPVGDEVLRHVARVATAGLRLADILFRCGSDEFVALLNDIDANSAALMGTRIREDIRASTFRHASNGPISLDIVVTAVCCPEDGESVPELIRAAQRVNVGWHTTASLSGHVVKGPTST